MIDEHKDRMESLMEAINSLSDGTQLEIGLSEDDILEEVYFLHADNGRSWIEINDSETHTTHVNMLIVEGDFGSRVCDDDEAIEHAQFWLTHGEHPEGTL